MFGHGEDFTETFLNEFDVFVVVLDTGGDDEALLGSDVVHNELLEHAGINVTNVAGCSQKRHTESVVTIGGGEEELSIVRSRVVLVQVVSEVVGLLVLGLSNVGGEDRAGFKSDINHHLEHVDGVVFDAVATEVHRLLVVVHGHVTTGHLDHTVVDGFVGMLKSLEVSVLESEESARGFSSLVTGADANVEA